MLVLAAMLLVGLMGSCFGAREVDPETKNHYKVEDIRPFLQAAEWTIFSLDTVEWEDPFAEGPPAPARLDAKTSAKGEPPRKGEARPELRFHGYAVLGQTKVAVTSELKTVITTMDAAGRHWDGGTAGCFTPRHGLRVMVDGVAHDWVICFECKATLIFRREEMVGAIQFHTGYPQWRPSPAFLNGALMRAKVKMPPPPSH